MIFVSKSFFFRPLHHSHTWQAVLWPNGTSMLAMQLPHHQGVPSDDGMGKVFGGKVPVSQA